MEISLKQIAEYCGGVVEGDAEAVVSNFAPIENGQPGCLSFLSNAKYEPYIYETQSTVVLVNRDFEPKQAIKTNLIRVTNAYEALSKLMQLAEKLMRTAPKGISSLAFVHESVHLPESVYVGPFAVIEEGAEIGEGVAIYPNVYVGANAKIGANTVLYPTAVVYGDCLVGKDCIIHAGAVIGADGFGFSPTPQGYSKIPQLGIVEIEDGVEIGANTCIDRAAMDRTVIHKGAKLDNLIQVAHNSSVGQHTVLAAQVGIAGSSHIGDWCMFGGQVGIAGHLKIEDKVSIGAQAGILGSLKEGASVIGTPSMPINDFMRANVVFRRLPKLLERVETLEKELAALKSK